VIGLFGFTVALYLFKRAMNQIAMHGKPLGEL
jgi:hypothetical protein